MLAASYAHQVLGTLPGWLTVTGVIAVGWILLRGGGPVALDTLVTANQVLAERVKELEAADRAKDKEIASLMAKTDIALALSPIMDWSRSHERRAHERYTATLALLQLIADRLGPEQEIAA